MIVIEVLIGALAVLLLLPVLVLFVQVLMAWLPGRASPVLSGRRPRVAVLVPAHDESAVITATLEALRPQLQAGDRLLVVADNCSDDTAALARAAGAEVLERTDHMQHGKGYALDFGVRHLESGPPEVLLIVDADCQVEAGSIECLARMAVAAGRPVQALDLMYSPPGAGLKMRIAEFAWVVKNHVRPLGFHRLGLPCQLMGTGMAFPWLLASSMQLANANIVEDMKLGIDLALAGSPPLFSPESMVTSEFPLGEVAAVNQRTRWEHGHLSMILQEVPRLLNRTFSQGDVRALALALDLLVPPLALLAIFLVAVLAAAGMLAALGGGNLPWQLALGGAGLFGTAVLMAWLGWGRRVVSLVDLLSVPFYVLAKIPLYFRFWTRRQKEWVKTDRE